MQSLSVSLDVTKVADFWCGEKNPDVSRAHKVCHVIFICSSLGKV